MKPKEILRCLLSFIVGVSLGILLCDALPKKPLPPPLAVKQAVAPAGFQYSVLQCPVLNKRGIAEWREACRAQVRTERIAP